jgi:hypothetical protein
MIHRRKFLVLLAYLTAVVSTARVSHPAKKTPANIQNKPGLVLHKGWVLRSDDPREL